MFLFLFGGEPKKLSIRYARNLDWILKRHEHAFTSTLVGRHFQQVSALVAHLSRRHFVIRRASQNFREGGFAGTIGSHNGVNLTLVNGEVYSAKDFFSIN